MLGMDQDKLKRARASLAVALISLGNVPAAAALRKRLAAVEHGLETTDIETTREELDDIARKLRQLTTIQPAHAPTGRPLKQNPKRKLAPAVDGAVNSVDKVRRLLGCKRLNLRGD